jgi:hypothetical protein
MPQAESRPAVALTHHGRGQRTPTTRATRGRARGGQRAAMQRERERGQGRTRTGSTARQGCSPTARASGARRWAAARRRAAVAEGVVHRGEATVGGRGGGRPGPNEGKEGTV